MKLSEKAFIKKVIEQASSTEKKKGSMSLLRVHACNLSTGGPSSRIFMDSVKGQPYIEWDWGQFGLKQDPD